MVFVCPVFIIFFKDEKKITSRDWGRGISKILKQYIKGEEKEEKVTHLGLILLNGSKAKQGKKIERSVHQKSEEKKGYLFAIGELPHHKKCNVQNLCSEWYHTSLCTI